MKKAVIEWISNFAARIPFKRKDIDKIIGMAKRKIKKADKAYPKPAFILSEKPKSPISEAYRMIRTNIQYFDTKKTIRSILVTSTGPKEGKTTTVVNLGCAFAQTAKRTLIVDLDLRNASFHKLFNLNNDFGFHSVISGQKRLEDVIHKGVLMPNLHVLTSGPKLTNPAETVGSKRIVDFINKIKELYDIIIFDSPPTLAVTDAKLLAVNTDAVILVIRSGRVAREAAEKAKQGLKEVGANIIGVVLNDLATTAESYYYYYRYYHTYYAKEKDRQEEAVALEEAVKEIPLSEQKTDVIIKKKKSLFVPGSFDSDSRDNSTLTNEAGSIATPLSEEEKKRISQAQTLIDKNSPLGRKPVFFEGHNTVSPEEKKPDKNKNTGSLGRKNMFKDI